MTPAERLARAVLLFYSGGDWTAQRAKQWKDTTGSDEATTKVLGDLAREVLGIRPPEPASWTPPRGR